MVNRRNEEEYTRIYLIRHGEVDNPNGIIYGRLPGFKMSEKGHKQALSSAEYLKNKSIPCDFLYHSPLLRTRETSKHFISTYNLSEDSQVQEESLILENKLPHFDGKTRQDFPNINHWDRYSNVPAKFRDENETFEELKARLREFLLKVRKNHHGKSVFAISHGGVTLGLWCWINNRLPTEGISALPSMERYPTYCCITEMVFDNNIDMEKPLEVRYHRCPAVAVNQPFI